MSDIEYKVGQEVWFINSNEVCSEKINKVDGEWLWFGDGSWPYSMNKVEIAPTKEALRIKVFGE